MKNSNKFSWSFFAKIVAVILFAFIVIAAILYARGVYDISFIDRNAGATRTEQDGYDTLPPIETAAPPEYTDIDDMGAPETQSASSVTFDDAATLSSSGSAIDTGIYSSDTHTIALATTSTAFPNVYSYRQMWEEVNVKKNAAEGGYVGATEYRLTDRKTITLYAGYIIYDCAGTLYLCSNTGEPLVSFAEGELEPAYCYNPDGEPLFLHNDRYCHYDSATKTMSEEDITYDHSVDSIGLYFEHSPSYGRGNGETRYRNEKWKWSFINSTNEDAYKYYGLYNFSESLAAAVELKIREVVSENVEVPITVAGGYQKLDSDGNPVFGKGSIVTYERNYELNYLDSVGNTALTGDKTYMNSSGKAVVASWQTPLFSHGKEAMGYLFFENGLCRVREITQDLEAESRVILSDTDYIIKSDGSRFPLPSGYEVVSYSSGMILLTRDGKYGFMNYLGEWVVQPVYTYAEPYFEGLAVIGLEDGTKAMIDTNGDIVIPFAYQHISNVSSGVIALYDSDTGWQIAYKMTKPTAEAE